MVLLLFIVEGWSFHSPFCWLIFSNQKSFNQKQPFEWQGFQLIPKTDGAFFHLKNVKNFSSRWCVMQLNCYYNHHKLWSQARPASSSKGNSAKCAHQSLCPGLGEQTKAFCGCRRSQVLTGSPLVCYWTHYGQSKNKWSKLIHQNQRYGLSKTCA